MLGARRVALRIVRAARQHLRKPMGFRRRPGPERDESRVRLLAARGAECRDHPLARRLRPLRRLIRQDKHRRKPVRPARIGADTAHPGAGRPVFDPRLLGGIPDLPPAPVLELRAHESDNMLEGDPGLLEARGDDHRLAPRHRKRPVQGRRRDPRQERRFPVAARHRQRRRLDARREGSAHEPRLPGQDPEQLAGRAGPGSPEGPRGRREAFS